MCAAALPPSIALVVRIAPSRRLRASLGLAALVHAGLAWHVLTAASSYAWPWLLGSVCVVATLLCAAAAAQPLPVHQIDISKAGALRLTVQQKLPDASRPVRLLPGSLLWGRLLVLRLASIDDAPVRVHAVLVLPDSTDRASLRALVVAMRAIAGHSSAGSVEKIG
jgi:hypothetical protein